MKYPKYLNNNSIIGITAPSSGVGGHIIDYEKSISNIKSNGFNIIETANVRVDNEVSSSAQERVVEFNSLISDSKIEAIMCATGGDFLTDMLPFVDYDLIRANPKWILGASDPTTLLYTITTICDIATIYGHNASSFDSSALHESQKYPLNLLKGEVRIQNSYSKYELDRDKRINGNYSLTEDVCWESYSDIDIKGRIIGGCIDCLKYLLGTKYDKTCEFVEKYKDDGIIWYFDIFSMTSEDFYLTLWQMKEAGWFKYTKLIIVGRVKYPTTYTSMTYKKALIEIFKEIPTIINADIGHIPPKMTVVNGSLAHVKYTNKKGTIEQFML